MNTLHTGTYIYADARLREDLDRRDLFGGVAKKLVLALVPLDRVELVVRQVALADERSACADQHRHRHLYVDTLQPEHAVGH